jgi:hypothetical protein
MLHETTKKFMEGFRDNAHPMAMLVSTVAALSTVYPEAKNIHDPANRLLQIKRLIGKMPSIAAMSYRHRWDSRTSIPTTTSPIRKLHEHAVEDGRAEVCRQSGDCAGARHPLYSARRPRAELQHQRHARGGQLAGRSLSGHGFGRGRSFRPAARRGQRRSAAHAGRDRHQETTSPPTSRRSRKAKAS